MKIILFQPEIPQNTGNIVRTCSVTGTDLILVRPLGFSTHSRHLKRAGLDYWSEVNIQEIDDLEAFLQTMQSFFFFSSKAQKSYTEAPYREESCLIFGSERSGLPKLFLEKYPDHFYKIPMLSGARCLNLATCAGIALYEGLRDCLR